jgi:hypothetical protein
MAKIIQMPRRSKEPEFELSAAELELHPGWLLVMGLAATALSWIRPSAHGLAPVVLLAGGVLCWLVSAHGRRVSASLSRTWKILGAVLAVASLFPGPERFGFAALLVAAGVPVWRNSWPRLRWMLLTCWLLYVSGGVFLTGGAVLFVVGLCDYLSELGGVAVSFARPGTVSGSPSSSAFAPATDFSSPGTSSSRR